MPRFNKSRPSSKARSRSDSRAPGNSRSRGKPRTDAKQSPNEKYAARARYKARMQSEAENERREPAVDRHLIAKNIMEKYGFEPTFSLVVNAKANAQDEETVKRVGATVKDMRHLLWSSIGNLEAGASIASEARVGKYW
ncbi:MAG: hypothetical protein NT051_06490 [Candidatus Micrarchaeota archaeon]|nr:hypothetical protein [Candidatus Micrarchaeota archaeon]